MLLSFIKRLFLVVRLLIRRLFNRREYRIVQQERRLSTADVMMMNRRARRMVMKGLPGVHSPYVKSRESLDEFRERNAATRTMLDRAVGNLKGAK